jgi:hypothetical protein
VQRQGGLHPGRFPSPLKVYIVFIGSFSGMLGLLLAALKGTDPEEIQRRIGAGSLALLVLLIGLPVYLASHRMEPSARRGLARGLSLLLVLVGFLILLYWILLAGVDPVAVAVAALAGAIGSISVLAWDLYKRRGRVE